MDVTVLCDAVAVFPEPLEDALPGWSSEHQLWTSTHAPGNVDPHGGWLLHFHSYLITGDHGAVLVDTGIGPTGSEASNWLGTTGRLPALLAMAGVDVNEIDTVILTHIHLDHTGWNTSPNNQPLFPNATYIAQQSELDHAANTPTYDHSIKPIAESGQLRPITGETILSQLRPSTGATTAGRRHPVDSAATAGRRHPVATSLGGIRLLPTPGHTPGHQSVVTPRAILGGDVLVHPAQARWPELTYVYERDPALAITSRHDVLALAATTGIPIAAAHPHTPLTGNATSVPVSTADSVLCQPYRL